MPPSLPRRDLLRLAGAGLIAGVAAACGTGRGSDGAAPADPAARRRLHARGYLTSRPRASAPGSAPTGLLPLQLSGSDRDGAVYVPPSYRHDSPGPLVLTLHGAGGRTWDVVNGSFGPDPEFVDRALDLVFARYAVDPSRLVAEGFSDGASYALSLGLLNGNLFTHVIAFSPGFIVEGSRRGKPRLFVSHGVHDRVLPIDLCSRRIVRDLRGDDFDIRYTEFDGGHSVPTEIARAALDWLAGRA